MSERKVPHYRIGDALGGGSMGRVYKAEHTLLQRTDALKFLSDELVSNQKAIRRFLSEAQMMAGLEHRHICRVYDIGQASDGTWYIAMAYYEGGTLKHLLDDGPLDTTRALEFARQTALGLAYAHDQGIVHRDIKPANLIVTTEETGGAERVKILDFGVARLLGSTQYTAPGAVVGTFGYLAPEQTRGDEITVAADIWSVGVVLFEMLTGKLPFPGDSHGAQLYAIAHNEPATLPVADSELDQGCAAIVDRCLQKEPGDRFASAHDLAAALQAVKGSEDPTLWIPDSGRKAKPRGPGRLLVALFTAAVVLAGVVFGPRLMEVIGLGGSGLDRTGLAVLPFSLVGPLGEAEELGHGLARCLNGQLLALDGASDEFWVAPSGDLRMYEVKSKEDARDMLGAWRVVTGSGGLTGQEIDLRLTLFDHRTGATRERVFTGSKANLKTWQEDLAAWVAGELDPDLAAGTVSECLGGCTTVPAAFLAYCRGVGILDAAAKGQEDAERGRALVHLGAAVEADSSFARARADLVFQEWLHRAPQDSAVTATALARLEAAARLDSTLVEAHRYRGLILAATGASEQALPAFDHALLLERSDPATLQGRADALAALDRLDEAEAAKRQAVAARPGYIVPYRFLGYFFYTSGEFEQARDAWVRVTELAPGNHWGFSWVGTAIWAGDLEGDAEEWFRRSLAIEPTEGVYGNLGTYFYYEARYEDAVLAYKSALTLAPDNEENVHRLAEAYRWSPGLEDSARVVYARAVELNERDLREDPDNVEILAELASYHSWLGQRERVRELLARLETLPRVAGHDAIRVAAAHEDLGQREEALAMLDHALATGGAKRVIEDYPGFRNLRADPRYRELMERYP